MTPEEAIHEVCPKCQHPGPHDVTLVANGHHYAKSVCGRCRKYIRWIPKPEGDPTKYRRPNAHRDLVEKFGRGYCEMCLRSKDALPKGQTLEGQHVIEFAAGGSNERDNVWILCTGCHRFVHWIRTYHGGLPGLEVADAG